MAREVPFMKKVLDRGVRVWYKGRLKLEGKRSLRLPDLRRDVEVG